MRTPRLRAVAVLALAPLMLGAGAAQADRGDLTSKESANAESGVIGAALSVGRALTGPVIPSLRSGNEFTGRDGKSYQSAGWTFKGKRGTVYLGQEVDAACYYGAKIEPKMRRLALLARIIEQSGRRVLFTVAPSKTSVNTRDLPKGLPHGSCDAAGMAAQNKILDNFTDPNYIPMRAQLAKLDGRGAAAYWDLDSHWTTVGATRWAQQVALSLDPRVAKLQRYQNGKRTHVPDIAYVIGQKGVYETAKARLTKTKVKVRPAPGSVAYNVETLSGFDMSWNSSPSHRTWPGKTLLLGDSFTYVGMESLQPLFQRGRFMWTGHTDRDDMIQGIVDSDTIVIEVAQRYVPLSPLTKPSTRLALRKALLRARTGIASPALRLG